MIRLSLKLIFLFFVSFSTLNAGSNPEDIDTLLDIYAKESDLSKKTKKEAAGNVIVYTRQDLERMQVKSLSELLKSIPFYRYNENRLGYTDLDDKFPNVSSDARVYINEREIISPFYGNSLGIISKYDLAYIDHVEIYTGVTSFEFGVEPASMVVRLYTKDPNREVGGQLKTSISSHNSSEHSVSYADILNDFSYYAYINKKNTKENKIKHENSDLSRDKESTHIFLSLQNDTNRIEYNRIEGKSDLFMDGIAGGDGSPTVNNTDASYNLLGWYSTYFDEKLSLSLDYIEDKSKTKQADSPFLGSLTVDVAGNPIPATFESYLAKQKEKQISAVLKYKESIGNHDLLFGLQYRKKDFQFKEIKISNVIATVPVFIPPATFTTTKVPLGEIDINSNLAPNLFNYTSEKLYGIFLEDTYSINDNQAIIAAVKRDYVKPNGGLEKQKLSLYRLGYIYSDENFNFKTFLVSTESRFDPNYYTRLSLDKGLKPQRDDSLNIEVNWKNKSYEYGINLFKMKQTNKLNGSGTMSEPYYKQGISFKNTYNFDSLNRVDTNFFVMNTDNRVSDEKDTVYGGYIRFLNTYENFDFYNELIYRDGYEGLKAGYDFNSAITYNPTKDLSISIKGENIFNKAINTVYSDSPKDLGPISTATRKFWFTMEYRF